MDDLRISALHLLAGVHSIPECLVGTLGTCWTHGCPGWLNSLSQVRPRVVTVPA